MGAHPVRGCRQASIATPVPEARLQHLHPPLLLLAPDTQLASPP
jgi:hypothetical protein